MPNPEDKRIGKEPDAIKTVKLKKKGEGTIEVPEADAGFMLKNGWSKA